MQTNHDMVIMGRFGKLYGVKGFIRIHSYTEDRDKLLQYGDWYIQLNHQWEAIEILKLEVQSKSIVALVKNYNTCESASALINKNIAVVRKNLPKLSENEYYWYDLIGLTVINHEKKVLGVIDSIMPTGSNDVLVVRGKKKHLIPFLPDQVIKDVDLNKKLMEVYWDSEY